MWHAPVWNTCKLELRNVMTSPKELKPRWNTFVNRQIVLREVKLLAMKLSRTAMYKKKKSGWFSVANFYPMFIVNTHRRHIYGWRILDGISGNEMFSICDGNLPGIYGTEGRYRLKSWILPPRKCKKKGEYGAIRPLSSICQRKSIGTVKQNVTATT